MKQDTKINTTEKGRRAEQVACEYLEARGYSIIERNFRCKLGEIDIIARHQGEEVFVEVRSGSSPRTIDPVYSVNRKKQNKVIQTAQYYLCSRFRQMPPARFDVVVVRVGHEPEVELIQNAFGLDSFCGTGF